MTVTGNATNVATFTAPVIQIIYLTKERIRMLDITPHISHAATVGIHDWAHPTASHLAALALSLCLPLSHLSTPDKGTPS